MASRSRSRLSVGGEFLSGVRGLFRGLRGGAASQDAAPSSVSETSRPDRAEFAGDLAVWEAELRIERETEDDWDAESGPDWAEEAPFELDVPIEGEESAAEPAQGYAVEADSAPQQQAAGKVPEDIVQRIQSLFGEDRLESDNEEAPDGVEAPHQAALPSAGHEVQDMAQIELDDDFGAEASDAGSAGGAERSGPSVMRKKDLVDAVTQASGQRKAVVKPVVDAVLAELGAALARGEGLLLRPLGKVSVARTRERGSADVLTLKLRRAKPGAPDAGPGDDAHEAAE